MEKKKYIQFLATPELKSEMIARAKELNMTLTSYLIYLVQKDLKKI